MIKQFNSEKKIKLEEIEVMNLVREISYLNHNIKCLFEELNEEAGKPTKSVSETNLKSIRISINKLKIELDKHI